MVAWAAAMVLGVGRAATPQELFTGALPREEFAARRAALMHRIGDGVAVIAGAAEYPAFVKFRQNNQFFYLCGVEVPRAILVVDGRAKTTTLYLPPRDERLERSEGPVLVPGDEARRVTGVDVALPREEFSKAVAAFAAANRLLYVPHRPESLGAGTGHQAKRHADASAADPWDGRLSKDGAFLAKLKAQAGGAEVRDLDPVIDEMRMVKSEREIALVRESTRISGLGLMEGMRSARPGMREYEVSALADYVFRRHNAQGAAYYALVATGKNSSYPHYHGSQSVLGDGDLVLFDYAPDYKYYSSDVTRMFPASGRFTAWQREIYTVYLRLYQALMTSIKPHVPIPTLVEEAVRKMDAFLTSATIQDPKIREAAQRFVDRFRKGPSRGLGHMVGMEVHDVGVPIEVYKAGMIFTIEPALTIPDDRVYVRLEDVILITESGYENLSSLVPVEIADIETLMAETGLGEKIPAAPTASGSAPGR